jgi:hypothetical protein
MIFFCHGSWIPFASCSLCLYCCVLGFAAYVVLDGVAAADAAMDAAECVFAAGLVL